MNLLAKARSVFFALLFAVAAAGGVWWLWVTVDSFGEELRNQMQTIANEAAFENQYAQLLTMVEESEAERTTLSTFILKDEDDTIALLSQLDDIAARQGVTLETQKLDVEETGEQFNQLILSYRLKGTEAAVMNMVRLFETLPYHSEIVALNIDRKRTESESITDVTAGITLNISIEKYD